MPPTPRGSAVISVTLIVPDVTVAVAWYREALEAIEQWSLGSAAGLEIEGAPIFLHEANPDDPDEDSPERIGVTSVRIELLVDDPDEVRARAIEAGATPGADVEEHEYSFGTHRRGGFRDPFGHYWSVGNRVPLRPWR